MCTPTIEIILSKMYIQIHVYINKLGQKLIQQADTRQLVFIWLGEEMKPVLKFMIFSFLTVDVNYLHIMISSVCALKL